MTMDNNTLTALKGVRVGHATHIDKLTGCTVIVFDKPNTVAYRSYGGAVGAFNTEGLRSGSTMYGTNGIFIAGGSMTGLMAASSITECLRKDEIGMKVSDGIFNPSLTGAIIWDLGTTIAPFDPEYGAEAYRNASSDPVSAGNVGAGTGATAGKFRWLENGSRSGAMKTGLGSSRVNLGNGITICALSVVNPMGNIVLPNNTFLAGNRDEQTKFKAYEELVDLVTAGANNASNTTISVVGINVELGSIENYERVAHIASHGQVRAINPVHTSQDGDTVFVFSNGEIKNPLNNMAQHFKPTENDIHLQVDIIGHAGAKAVQQSIYDACMKAETIQDDKGYQGVIPSANDYMSGTP